MTVKELREKLNDFDDNDLVHRNDADGWYAVEDVEKKSLSDEFGDIVDYWVVIT